MKIETKFAPGDKVYLCRPEDWDWTGPGRMLPDECRILYTTISESGDISYRVNLADEALTFPEEDLYASRMAAEAVCTVANLKYNKSIETEEKQGGTCDCTKCLKAIKRLEEKVDQLLRKEIDDGK